MELLFGLVVFAVKALVAGFCLVVGGGVAVKVAEHNGWN